MSSLCSCSSSSRKSGAKLSTRFRSKAPRSSTCSIGSAARWVRWMVANLLIARMRRSTSSSSSGVTRSVLFRMMTSAKAIWSSASWLSSSRAGRCLASTTVTTASSRVLARTPSSTKKVCATGAGLARPVVSMMMPSNLSRRFISPPTMRIRSPRTVQQMQPLFISNTSSSVSTTRSLSTPSSPNSLITTAYLRPCCSLRMRLRRVVLPAPR